MTRHGWLTAKADADILFETPARKRWAAAMQAQGIDPRQLSSSSGTA